MAGDIVPRGRGSECRRLHGEAGSFLEAEEQIHGVDRIAGGSLQQVVDHGSDEQFAVHFVEMDDALVGVDHILQIGNLGRYEREVMIVEIFLV